MFIHRSISVMRTNLFVAGLLFLCLVRNTDAAAAKRTLEEQHLDVGNRHSNNWVVIVDTSIFFFNYRHSSNALSMYRTVKKLGIPDSQIVLMLADDMACHPSNAFKAQVFNNKNKEIELYGDSIEVDYRGHEVTVENFLRVLLGRHPPGTPASKRLDTNEGSNIFVYMSGHGGNEFLKFRDTEEISSQDIGGAFEQMRVKGRYKEMFFAVDTCQATTLHRHVISKNVLSVGSSMRNENSYSHHNDPELGTPVIDRFTYHTLEFMEQRGEKATIGQLMRHLTPAKLMSNAKMDTSLFSRPAGQVRLTDFLGSVLKVDTSLASRPEEISARHLHDFPSKMPQEAKSEWDLDLLFDGLHEFF